MTEMKQMCANCGKCADESGWVNLCSRRCYHDMGELLYAYDKWIVDEPDPRVVEYISNNPDGGSYGEYPPEILQYVYDKEAESAYDDHVPKCVCAVCGESAEGSGWVDLCSRRCYHDMSFLLDLFESGSVEYPDNRVIEYFTNHPDGGGHAFDPESVLTYIGL